MMMNSAVDLKVVRVVKDLDPPTLMEIMTVDGEQPYFNASDEAGVVLVDNDHPRDGAFSSELIEKTLGFALVDTLGRVHAKYKDLGGAMKALAGAKVTFDVNVRVGDEEENNDGE